MKEFRKQEGTLIGQEKNFARYIPTKELYLAYTKYTHGKIKRQLRVKILLTRHKRYFTKDIIKMVNNHKKEIKHH